MIVDRQPDVIVQLGDWADMKSLSSYDKGRKDFEGRRYEADINAANAALKIIDDRLRLHNESQRKSKKEQYRPRKIALGGNHEARIDKLVQLHPEFDGVFSVENIKFREYGWEFCPYEQAIEINGVWYSHCFPTGNSGEPISGINLAQSLIAKNMVTSVVGHSHILDVAMRSTPGGKRIWGISAGCFFTHKMPYARATQDRFWWAGTVLLKRVCDGDFSPEIISIEEMEELYA